jgi:hypothetical protein
VPLSPSSSSLALTLDAWHVCLGTTHLTGDEWSVQVMNGHNS